MIVVGAGGQLGTAFKELLGPAAVYLTRNEVDLTSAASVSSALRDTGGVPVVNCAAYTAVDAAEADAAAAFRVNADAVGEMAALCADQGSRFVTFSTDYVFDGTKAGPYVESDETNPLSVYGASKLAGEQRALQYDSSLVVRTSWVLSGTHANFAATMLRLMAAGDVNVVDDQRGCPTLADDLASATLAAIEVGATGILHLVNAGPITWYDLAMEIAEIAGYDAGQVHRCTTGEFPRPARRPANSELGSERLEPLGLPAMPHHNAGLVRAVERLLADA